MLSFLCVRICIDQIMLVKQCNFFRQLVHVVHQHMDAGVWILAIYNGFMGEAGLGFREKVNMVTQNINTVVLLGFAAGDIFSEGTT